MRKSRGRPRKLPAKTDSDNEDDEPLVKPSSSNEEDEEHEVEKIINVRTKKGNKEYLVRWKGFSEDQDTWESEDNLNCPEIVAQFKAPAENSHKNKTKKGRKRKVRTSESSRKKHKNTKDSNDEEKDSNDEDDDTEYEVERVLEVHHKKDGSREFLVHWKGFPKSEESWEPEKNLNCQELIDKFLEKVSKAKSSSSKETRVNRKATDRYVLNAPDHGRKLSGRNKGPRRTYYDNE